jgi:ABC-2 type transport system permease protein
MGKLLVVFKREYLERVRSKWFLIGTLLGPVFFALITVVPILISAKTRSSTDLADVTIIDATSSGMGERVAAAMVRRFPLSPAPEVRSVDAASVPREEDRATLSVQQKETRGYLVLDCSRCSRRRRAATSCSTRAPWPACRRSTRVAMRARWATSR